MAQSPNR